MRIHGPKCTARKTFGFLMAELLAGSEILL